jgi:hypothetical protein
MIADPITQWAFTLVFAILALYSGYRVIADWKRPLQAVGHGLHVVMAADMAAMPWPWWVEISRPLQIVVFAVAAAWFLVLLVLQVRRVIPRRAIGGHGPWHGVGHGVMMLAMVWMVTVMSPLNASAISGRGDEAAPASGHAHSSLSAWPALTGVATTAALVVAGVILLVELVECVRGQARTWRGHTGDVGSGTVMSIGMAAMCWLMLTA